MREILFRGKRIDNDEWIEGNLIINNRDDEVYIGLYEPRERVCGLEWNVYNVIPTTTCQYTGLTDKNGQKIWEGDIIKNTANIHWDLQEVKYGNCRNWILDGVRNKPFKASKCSCLVSIEAQQIFEVIGNIFDNRN